MSFTIYSARGKVNTTPSNKRDIHSLPFADIETSYRNFYSALVDEELELLNTIGKNMHDRTVARLLASRNASSEENPDDAPEYEPITHIDPDTDASYRTVANEQAVTKFAEENNIAASWSWLAPQLLAYLGNYTLPTKVDGVISCKDFLNLNVKTEFDLGIYRLITKIPRGRLMKQQTDSLHLPVCSLVPIYMAAQKRANGTKFSEWSRSDLAGLVDKELYVAMTAPPLPGPYDPEELLQIRNTGLRYVSRSKKELGVTKSYSPETYHMLAGVSESLIGGLNKYAKAMLCQIWCAHPNNRSKYMILDPYDWDNIPEPLINTNVIKEHPAKSKYPEYEVHIPWE